jgi:hypothetical protein
MRRIKSGYKILSGKTEGNKPLRKVALKGIILKLLVKK